MNLAELKRFAMLADLNESELELLQDLLEPTELREGQQLFREGQEADGLVLIDRGTLRFEAKRGGDLGTVDAGGAFGALSLVVVGPREMSAFAATPAKVWLLSRTAFHRLSEDAPRASNRLLETIVREIAGLVRAGLDKLA